MAEKINPTEALSMGIYHFHPRWTISYGDSIEKRIEEFEDVMKEGYFNSIIVELEYINNDEFWRVIFENDANVWFNIYDSYHSKNGSFEEWDKEREEAFNILKQHPERWERLVGFHFDEPVWRGQSNEDFLTMTKNLREKYGKRIFPVFATGEFMHSEGNAMQIGVEGESMGKIAPEALKYVTDIAYDSYCVDVRFGFDNGGYPERMGEKFPGIVDGKTYYDELNKFLVSLVGHDVNVWFFPTCYTTALWRGGRADEGYCTGHLEFFCELLMKQKYQGGLCLYNYKNHPTRWQEFGLSTHLSVRDKNGKQKLWPTIPNWEMYSECLKNATKKFKNTKARLAEFDF